MSFFKDIFKENKKILLLTLGLFLVTVIGVFFLNLDTLNSIDIVDRQTYTEPKYVIEEGLDYDAVIRTEYGDINIELYENQSPNAVNSFLFLAGEDFYDGLTFHKVVKDFVIQAGDQLGNGEGNPGYTLELDKSQLEVEEYSVCMANASQFFIVSKGADIAQLQSYPVIGEVTSGYAVVDAIEKVNVNSEYRPIRDVTINSILIEEKEI
jgi:cyclophilin family peptidyl-prolyl cis-trans isomerase